MLVVIASLPGKSDKREECKAALVQAAQASRGDAGCISYTFSVDLENPDRYVSVELWEDQASLDAHFGAPARGRADDPRGRPARRCPGDQQLRRHLTMRVLLSTTSGAGHFRPLLPVARALADAGHEIACAAPEEARAMVEREGASSPVTRDC